ncbi:MAG TPA: hypothetical protein VEU31_00040 [Candidatus Acidoferrales bacterium]|nr:hypothetical protein [Candidatus Acidoferrales bacterium]
MSGLAHWEQWLWALILCAEVGVCYVILRRSAFQYLPFLFFYVLSDLTLSGALFLTYRHWGFSSRPGYVIGWSARAVVMSTRGMAVTEVCKNCLRAYRGIWAAGWRILTSVGALVAMYAGLSALMARHKAFWVTQVVLAADRGLELALVAVLLALLLFVRYYEVELRPPQKALVLGFCFYSCVLVLNNTILSVWLNKYASLWNGIQMSSYFVVLVAWLQALYKLVPARPAVPVLLPRTLYEEYAPQFNYRLRLLNDRLTGMLKS